MCGAEHDDLITANGKNRICLNYHFNKMSPRFAPSLRPHSSFQHVGLGLHRRITERQLCAYPFAPIVIIN